VARDSEREAADASEHARAADRLVETDVYIDTTVTIEVVASRDREAAERQVRRALGWFEEVERRCSRFDPTSELVSLSRTHDLKVVGGDSRPTGEFDAFRSHRLHRREGRRGNHSSAQDRPQPSFAWPAECARA
jgi:hypothetical protein